MVIERNTIKPSHLLFLVQEQSDSNSQYIHLVLLSNFHNVSLAQMIMGPISCDFFQANYRVQLILRANILKVEKEGDVNEQSIMPRMLLVEDTSIEKIVKEKSMRGTFIEGYGLLLSNKII
jgi:hypothetical protein